MTNEEKASEIANTYGSEVLQAGAYFGAEKMAKWKDQQFKEYLEKIQSELDGTRNKNNYELLEDIINEFFKEETK